MARPNGRHRISRSTKIATAGVGLAMAIGAIVVVNTAGSPTSARADAADPSFFVDITKVKANVKEPKDQGDASTGTFTVDCGENQNGHFNPDNFIAQPGIKNGAQHLHDYVGNLSTNADSNNKSLLAAGTTCANGDQSAYFWPVIRIDRADNNGEKQADKAKKDAQQNKGNSNKDNQNRKNDTGAGAGAGAGADNANQNANQQDQADQNADNKNKNQDAQANADQQKKNQQAGKNQDAQQQNKKNAQQGDNNAGQDAKTQDGQQQQQDKNNNVGGKAAQDNKNNAAQNQDGQQNNQQDKNKNADQNKGGQAAELPGVNDKNEVAGNDGEIVEPANAELTFRGSPTGDVVAMPKFLRILYGDAKVNLNGAKNARDSWTCAGFEDKVLMNKYPICPNGAAVKRIHAFPSCWDGKNTDSTNHRDHIVFADNNGNCKNGFKAVPQLVVTLTYNIPQDVQEKGQYKVDSFPEEEHDPFSDHDDFANVMSNQIMTRVVDCINEGKTCKE
jgi:hypothetical protein